MNEVRHLVLALASVAAITASYRVVLGITNHTTTALTYLLVVLFIATASTLRVAILVSIATVLCLNFFFMPPFGTFTVADPENWVALVVFLVVSVIASNLSSSVRSRAREAFARREEVLAHQHGAALARQSSELRSALLASLAHDLRTPLTSIRVAANNLAAGRLDETGRREQAEIVLLEVERLNRLFQNILDMARIDTQAVTTAREWVTPAEIVDAAVAQVHETLRNHRLIVNADNDQTVHVDPRVTSAALAHLVENAAQYSPADSTVRIEASADVEGLSIIVSDEGLGIDAGDLPHLFERFYRGTDARHHAFGTGMGLAITRGLLAVHGGRAWAANGPGGGARFTIVVPAEIRASMVETI